MELSAIPLTSILTSQNQKLDVINGVSLWIKREDLIHPDVPGNKWRKLKYNLIEARKQHQSTLLTFGGAYSNHIAAVASAGRLYKFSTIGIIRGEELSDKIDDNPTLKYAVECGMQLHFIPRNQYKEKDSAGFLSELGKKFGDFYLLPEGGTNHLAVKGCGEIITNADKGFEYICTAVGTGGTLAGILSSSGKDQQVLGFPAIKGNFAEDDFLSGIVTGTKCKLIQDYHFGGYGKTTPELIEFINEFYRRYKIKLDPVYTGKMFFGIVDLMQKGYYKPGSSILAIHTGGLQGIEGMNAYLTKKKQPLIKFYD